MKTTPSLAFGIDGHPAGLLLCEAPEVWRFRADPAGGAHGRLPRWSALVQEGAARGNARAWFRQLLPDAAQCVRLAHRLGVTPGHEFALLAQLGQDCQGALSLTRSGGESVPVPRGQFPCVLAGEGVALVGGAGNTSTWVARLGREGLEAAVDNEALCMALAAELELPVPASRHLPGPVPLLLTARLDRLESPGGIIRRRHIENFGQLAGLHPEQAYEREGGLGVSDCADLVRRHSTAPVLDLRALLRWLVYCFLAGIGQAHARHLCLVALPTGPRLAFGGGLLSTHVYPALSERMAMRIGGEDRPDWIRLARWLDMARELGVGRRYMLGLLEEMATAVPRAAERAAATLGEAARTSALLPRILRLVANRARQTTIALAAERA
jgi:serine/threonine-protein kinase HipA